VQVGADQLGRTLAELRGNLGLGLGVASRTPCSVGEPVAEVVEDLDRWPLEHRCDAVPEFRSSMMLAMAT
jgi:hypothetical protein